MEKIIVIEDEEKIRNELVLFLERNGYEVVYFEDFTDIVQKILDAVGDLVLLDINLPHQDGMYICKEVRKVSDIPMMMVTSRMSELDELISLNNGADQYITKPYNMQILLARIHGLIKCNKKNYHETISCGAFALNIATRMIETKDKKIELTNNEYKILECLALNRGKIVQRDDLMNFLWDSEVFVDDNDVSI